MSFICLAKLTGKCPWPCDHGQIHDDDLCTRHDTRDPKHDMICPKSLMNTHCVELTDARAESLKGVVW